jgi:hypothetical protein
MGVLVLRETERTYTFVEMGGSEREKEVSNHCFVQVYSYSNSHLRDKDIIFVFASAPFSLVLV